MLKADLKRFIFSIEMIVAIIITAIGLATGISFIITDGFSFEYTSLIQMYNFCIFTGLVCLFFPIIAAIPITNTLITEQESGFKNMILTRTSRKKYIISRIVSVSITGFLCLFLGSLLFLIIFYICGVRCVASPGHDVEAFLIDSTYWDLIENDKEIIALLLMITVLSVSGIGRSVITLALCHIVKNKYIVLILPFVLERILVLILDPLETVSKVFFYLNPVVWDAFGTEMINSTCGGLLYVSCVQLCLAAVGTVAYIACIKRQHKGGH